ncbi:MAG: glutamine synthetase family protein, partial [Planctomycetota bacterium]|nr:glutamine synthetase family protein [Planctomycetota bacterium]
NSKFTGWHTGYPDTNAKIDLSTYRRVPWENELPFFLADFNDAQGQRLPICPRGLLKTAAEAAEKEGYQARFSQEFEWFNFQETSANLHDTGFRVPEPISRGMFGYSVLRASQNKEFFHDLFDSLRAFNVPLEGLHTETGPGVYEAAIAHNAILEAADRAVLFKTATKEIGHDHGVLPTFMAKWNSKYPGCSGHLHQSLWQGNRNVFHDNNGRKGMSKTMEHYIAGLLHCLPHCLPMYAPTINSYKRLVEGAWAPTTLTWAVDNRTVAVRALPGSPNSSRIELRVPGSDANPYLAMTAALQSGLYGIRNQLPLDVTETVGNGYENKTNGTLPPNLLEASEAMRNSSIAKELFGDVFVEHFCNTRQWEWIQFQSKVTDWELKRYFEII